MPQAESKLGELLGAGYKPAEWKGAFDTGFAADNDTPATVATVEKLCDYVNSTYWHSVVDKAFLYDILNLVTGWIAGQTCG